MIAKAPSNRQVSLSKWQRVAAGDLDDPTLKQWLQSVAADVLKAERLKAADMRAALPRAVRLDGQGSRVVDKDRKTLQVLERARVLNWGGVKTEAKRKLRVQVASEAFGRAAHALNQDAAMDAHINRVIKGRDAQIAHALALVLGAEGLNVSDWPTTSEATKEQARSVAALLFGDFGREWVPVRELDRAILAALENN